MHHTIIMIPQLPAIAIGGLVTNEYLLIVQASLQPAFCLKPRQHRNY
ncbi:hypothetical protein IQ243_03335 [Nostocales cyanobacterium LEGE 11386]|nr:hypothetical protein [Nostocales cyanobacterium LEGE 11386]